MGQDGVNGGLAGMLGGAATVGKARDHGQTQHEDDQEGGTRYGEGSQLRLGALGQRDPVGVGDDGVAIQKELGEAAVVDLLIVHGEESRAEVVTEQGLPKGCTEEVEAQHGLGTPQKGIGGGHYPRGGQKRRQEAAAQHRDQCRYGVGQQGNEQEAGYDHRGVVGAETEVVVSHLREFLVVGDEEGNENTQRHRKEAEQVAQEELLSPRRAYGQVEDALLPTPQEAEGAEGGEDTEDHGGDADGDLGALNKEGEHLGLVALKGLAQKGEGGEQKHARKGDPPVTAHRPKDLVEQGVEFIPSSQRGLRRHSSFLPSSFRI